MAESQKIFSRNKVELLDHDPGSTSATIATTGSTKHVKDMRDYEYFGVGAIPTVVGGGGLTKLEIVAFIDGDSTGAGTAYVIKDSGTVAADAALVDQVFIECSASEIAQVGSDNGVELRYVAARLTNATNTDEVLLTYIRSGAKNANSDLTATTIT